MIVRKRFNFTTDLRFGLAIFFYTLIAGLLIRLLLPWWMPHWVDPATGLLKGGDWLRFHSMSEEIARQMHQTGWSAWKLRPLDQQPAAVGSLLYYFFGSHSWLFIPFNGLVHALSGMILAKMIRRSGIELKFSLLSALPFVVFPTTLLWITQIHKDGIMILGLFSFLFGFLQVLSPIQDRWKESCIGLMNLLMGGWLMWWVRPYLPFILKNLSWVAIWGLVAYWGMRKLRKRPVPYSLRGVGLLIVYSFSFQFYPLYIFTDEVPVNDVAFKVGSDSGSGSDSKGSEGVGAAVGGGELKENAKSWTWERSPLLPKKIDYLFFQIARQRSAFILDSSQASSNVDSHVFFRNAWDLIAYLPKALKIGFFTPFPCEKFVTLRKDGLGALRGFVMMETFFASLAILVFAFKFFGVRRSLPVLVLSFFAVGLILIYALVTPNIGTLHRVRFGPLMVLTGLGIASLQHWLPRIRSWVSRYSTTLTFSCTPPRTSTAHDPKTSPFPAQQIPSSPGSERG